MKPDTTMAFDTRDLPTLQRLHDFMERCYNNPPQSPNEATIYRLQTAFCRDFTKHLIDELVKESAKALKETTI